ncbi:MAG: hypothetical protein Q7S95_00340 [bacterium]|nr:hypothetical protein [bacterium]
MANVPRYDPGSYGITPYVLVEIVYELKGRPGVRAKYLWAGYDFPPVMPALQAFLARFIAERGMPLTSQTVAAWNVDHRELDFAGATATLQ